MNTADRIGLGFMVTIILLVVAGVYGWIANIYTIAHMADWQTPMFFVRCIGVFIPPLGAVLGFV